MGFSQLQCDVALVWPPSEEVIESYDHPDYPHIGLAYVGNYLERTSGITPAIFDARLARMNLEETVDQVVSLKPKVVGISAMTHMVIGAAELGLQVKKRLPDVALVLGGVHATFLPERTLLEFPIFDFVVAGEGEKVFVSLVEALLSGDSVENIPGLCFKKGDRIVFDQQAPVSDDLDELGEPGWHLFDAAVMNKYCKRLPVFSQRGCPFSCNFCSRPYGKKNRRRSPDKVVEEIRNDVNKFGITDIWIYDENFTVNKNHAAAICRGLLKEKVRIRFECMLHVSTIDDRLAKLMKDAGCWHVGFGVESGNDEILAGMNKGINKKMIFEAHSIMKKSNFVTEAYFILGHPNENKSTIWDTIKFAVQLNAARTAIGIMVPYPGTEVWEMATHGRGGYKKLSINWSDYNKQLGNAVELESLSRTQLEIAQVLGYSLVYLGNMRFRDFGKMVLENYRLVIGMILKILGLEKLKVHNTIFGRG